MTFVKNYDGRFRIRMWSDSRLVNKQVIFCLCSNCVKEQYNAGIRCQKHRVFMAMTRLINIVAPVFACLDFVEREGSNHLNELYEPMREKIESHTEEERYDFMEEWGETL